MQRVPGERIGVWNAFYVPAGTPMRYRVDTSAENPSVALRFGDHEELIMEIPETEVANVISLLQEGVTEIRRTRDQRVR